MYKILIVDDDQRIGEFLAKFLTKNGYNVVFIASPVQALQQLSELNIDLIILDVMMPELSGIEFTEKLRIISSVPVIILSAIGNAEGRIQGLRVGADDYVAKPFEPEELLLRIKSLFSRLPKVGSTLKFGNWVFNPRSLTIDNGNLQELSSSEAKLLKILYDHNNQAVSREALSQAMGGINERSIDVQIIRLRQKIEVDPKKPSIIKTIRHQGYLLVR
ncbi:MAG: response regulator transcription factor [Pseudomonadota bacterium]